MKLRNLLRDFSIFGYELRYRAALPYWLKWIREFFRYFQIIFFVLDACTLNQLSSRPPTVLRILNNTGLLNSWSIFTIFSVQSSLVALIYELILSYSFIRDAYLVKKGEFVSKFKLYFYAIHLEFAQPVTHLHMFYNFNNQVLHMMNKFDLNCLINSLNFALIIIIFACHDYIASIYIRSKIYLTRSMLDCISSNTDQKIYWMRFIMVTTQVLLVNKYNYLLEMIIFFTIPVFFFYVLTKRITKGIHPTMFGAVLIDSPLFSYFFVMFAHLHPNKIFNPTFVLIISLFSYKFIYYLYQIFLRKYAYLILNEQYEPPFWLPINNCLVMRIAAETDADITQFENYMNLRLKQDPDEMIEVVRFLGIFKNQRE